MAADSSGRRARCGGYERYFIRDLARPHDQGGEGYCDETLGRRRPRFPPCGVAGRPQIRGRDRAGFAPEWDSGVMCITMKTKRFKCQRQKKSTPEIQNLRKTDEVIWTPAGLESRPAILDSRAWLHGNQVLARIVEEGDQGTQTVEICRLDRQMTRD